MEHLQVRPGDHTVETEDRDALLEVAREILGEFLLESQTEFRRVGIRVGGLKKRMGQKSLFDY